MSIASAVRKGAALAAVLAIKLEWRDEDGKLDKLKVLGIPVFDRRRMEARRAARAQRKAGEP